MMNNFNITIHDFENVCRTCLSREDLKPLYGKYLVDMLMACTFVKFRENDGLPEKICTNCINEIGQAISFANRCEATDTILRKCVKKFETELANNSSQSQRDKEDIILPNIHRTVKEVLKHHEYMEEVNQEEDLTLEIDSGEPANESHEEDVNEDQDETNSEKSSSAANNSSQSPKDEQISTANEEIIVHGTVKEILKEEVKHEEELIIEDERDEPANESYEEDVDEDQEETNSDYPGFNSQIKENRAKDEDDPSHFSKIKPKHREVKHPPTSVSQISSLGQPKNVDHSEPIDQKYQCQTCDKSFKRLALLQTHQKMHTGEEKDESYEEDFADERYKEDFADENYEEDFADESDDEDFADESDEEDFADESDEKDFADESYEEDFAEDIEKSGARPFVCQVCGKSFNYARTLNLHKRLHTGEKLYICSVCSKAFTRKAGLKLHKRIHTSENPYSCEVCSKVFTYNHELKTHMRMHTGEKPYNCEVCSKTFTRMYGLKCHMRIHTGEKPYSCGVCSKAFIVHKYLKKHIREHTGESPTSV